MANVVDYKIIEDRVRELRCIECGAPPALVEFDSLKMNLTVACGHDTFLPILNDKYNELKNDQTKMFVRIV